MKNTSAENLSLSEKFEQFKIFQEKKEEKLAQS